MISAQDRRRFDQMLEQVIAGLPDHLTRLMEEIPVIVEDRASNALLAEMNINPRTSDLCGLHSGIPLIRRSVQHSGTIPDRIMLFREPIIRLAEYEADRRDRPDQGNALERQIRITLLHEIGHHFGLNEEDLQKLGYG